MSQTINAELQHLPQNIRMLVRAGRKIPVEIKDKWGKWQTVVLSNESLVVSKTAEVGGAFDCTVNGILPRAFRIPIGWL